MNKGKGLIVLIACMAVLLVGCISESVQLKGTWEFVGYANGRVKSVIPADCTVCFDGDGNGYYYPGDDPYASVSFTYLFSKGHKLLIVIDEKSSVVEYSIDSRTKRLTLDGLEYRRLTTEVAQPKKRKAAAAPAAPEAVTTGPVAAAASAEIPTSAPTPAPTAVPTATPRACPQYQGRDLTSVNEVTVGSVVTFGAYEQDNSLANGQEPLLWLVLEKSGRRMLLITERIIDVRAYHSIHTSVRWKNSDVRAWLNDTFFHTAFTDAEQALIPEVAHADIGNESYGIKTGSESWDRVFFLNTQEVGHYLPSRADRVAQPTDYANARGFTANPDGWWWLRNPGEDTDHAALVDKSGNIYQRGDRVEMTVYGVRPAIYVELP